MAMAKQPHVEDFLETARRECFATLAGIVPLA
jgi:hypothetical protein